MTWSLPHRHQKEEIGILPCICTLTVGHDGQKSSCHSDPDNKGIRDKNRTSDSNSQNMQFQHVLAGPFLLNDGLQGTTKLLLEEGRQPTDKALVFLC